MPAEPKQKFLLRAEKLAFNKLGSHDRVDQKWLWSWIYPWFVDFTWEHGTWKQVLIKPFTTAKHDLGLLSPLCIFEHDWHRFWIHERNNAKSLTLRTSFWHTRSVDACGTTGKSNNTRVMSLWCRALSGCCVEYVIYSFLCITFNMVI